MKKLVLLLLLFAVLETPLAAQQRGYAQRAPRGYANRYAPSRPTVSPYLNLFRNNNGVVPNYYTLVRPQLDQMAVNQQQQQALAAQGTAIQNLQQNVIQLRTPGLRATGTGSGFGNYSHYYPGFQR